MESESALEALKTIQTIVYRSTHADLARSDFRKLEVAKEQLTASIAGDKFAEKVQLRSAKDWSWDIWVAIRINTGFDKRFLGRPNV